jgi:hypothetical protein
MKKIVRFESANGPVLIEVEDADATSGPRSVARGSAIVEDAGERFETALAGLRPIAEAILGQLTSLTSTPETVEVRFGMKISGELGVVLASSAATAHCEVKLGWTRPESN